MRKLVLLVLVAGCHDFPKHAPGDGGGTKPEPVDADIAGPDASFEQCTAPPGSADITVVDGTTTFKLQFMDAGGILQSGPSAPLSAFPMSLDLVFVQTDTLDTNTIGCCTSLDTTCCPIGGIFVRNDALQPGTEIGDHPITIQSFQDASFQLSGVLTITKFINPFDQPEGELAGSISASGASGSVSGTLDNAFCPGLLAATI